MNAEQEKQVAMHRDQFDRSKAAIDNGFYFEALMLEYAAIESRLEAILGVLGLPCGQKCICRKDIKISNRIECLRFIRRHTSNFDKSKLDKNFFTNKGVLRTWVRNRDVRVHGLYKNPQDYDVRIEQTKELAQDGFIICDSLYKEAKRIRNLKKNHPDEFQDCANMCKCRDCKAFSNEMKVK